MISTNRQDTVQSGRSVNAERLVKSDACKEGRLSQLSDESFDRMRIGTEQDNAPKEG